MKVVRMSGVCCVWCVMCDKSAWCVCHYEQCVRCAVVVCLCAVCAVWFGVWFGVVWCVFVC
jgi:hypothetical protein